MTIQTINELINLETDTTSSDDRPKVTAVTVKVKPT